mgnify:CR=1 FL=1
MSTEPNLINSNINPLSLFAEWFEEAKKSEINDPNAMNLATISDDGKLSSRIVLLKSYSDQGFVFYTNSNSKKGKSIKNNTNVALNFHWKSLQKQIRVEGTVSVITNAEADEYYNSRPLGSRIGAWASNQSSILKTRDQLLNSIKEFKKKYPNENEVPRPKHWSGWNLNPVTIEFWLDGKNRIHERLLYTKNKNNGWEKNLLSP